MSKMRFTVASLATICLLTVLLLSGCRALRLTELGRVDAADWTTEGAVPQRTHAADLALPPPLEEVWIYDAGAGFGPGSPLILGGYVLAATRKGEVHAIDFVTGKKRGMERFGDTVEGTPTADGSTLYVPGGWGRRALYAYDLQRGARRWAVKDAPIDGSPLLMGQTLVAVDMEGVVRGYDPADGSVRWSLPLEDAAAVHAAPVALNLDDFAVANDRGHVASLAAAGGQVHWTHDLGAPVYATPATDARRLFLPTTRGLFVALDAATGQERWRYALADTTVRFASPAVADGLVFFGGTDGILRALDAATGETRWQFGVDEAFAAAPLVTRDLVYIGSLGRMLYAVDRRTGEQRWETELRGRVKSALAAKDGHLVVLTEPRYVYLFRPAATEVATN